MSGVQWPAKWNHPKWVKHLEKENLRIHEKTNSSSHHHLAGEEKIPVNQKNWDRRIQIKNGNVGDLSKFSCFNYKNFFIVELRWVERNLSVSQS